MLFLALSSVYHTFNEVPCSSKLSHFNFHLKRQQEYQKDLTPQSSCIISNLCLPWTSDIARKFHIPRISFHREIQE
nr:udp-glycosyltransferase 73c5 [Quercus suber]